MKFHFREVFIILLSWIFCWGTFAQPLADLVSEDTSALITFRDIKDIDLKQLKTVWGQFCQLPEMKEVCQNWDKDIVPLLNFLDSLALKNTGVSTREVLTLFQGEASLAFTFSPDGSYVTSFAVDYSGQKSFLERVLTMMAGTPKQEKLGNSLISNYGDNFFISFGETRLLGATSKAMLSQLVEGPKGINFRCLSQSSSYQKLRKGDELFFCFFNTKIPFELISAKQQSGLADLGLLNCEGVSLSYGYEEEYLVGRFRLAFKNKPSGLFAPNRTEGLVAKDVSHLRGNLISATAYCFSIESWYLYLKKIFNVFPPNVGQGFEIISQKVKASVGFSIDEIAGFFGETYTSWKVEKTGHVHDLFALELKKPENLLKFFSNIEQFPQVSITKNQYKGTTIFQFGVSGTGSEGATNAFAVGFALFFYGYPSNFMIYENQLIAASLPHYLWDYLDAKEATGQGPLESFGAQVKGKQSLTISYAPERAAAGYRSLIHFLKRFNTVARTFGIPLDFGSFPRAKDVLSLIRPGIIQSYYQENCFNFELKYAFPLTADEANLGLVGVGSTAVIAAVAIPGLLRARISSNQTSAVGSLRSLTTAQAQFQAIGIVDQDKDGIGEYGCFQELSGIAACRGETVLNPPVISSVFGTTAQFGNGIANKSGYNFVLYLPTASGNAVKEPGNLSSSRSMPSNSADADFQEENWIVYAWPISAGNSGNQCFCVTADGVIYVSSNTDEYGNFKYSGMNVPEPDAAFAKGTGAKNLAGTFAGSDEESNDGLRWLPYNY